MTAKPRHLRSGDKVGLVEPSGACDRGRLELGCRVLESWGLEVAPLAHGKTNRYFGADDRSRAEALSAAFSDPDIDAILAVRGGYGCARLLDHFDCGVAAANPKIFVGFSDVSLLLTRLLQDACLTCFHGPMIAADFPRLDDEAKDAFRRFLFGEPAWFGGEAGEVWRPGSGRGRLTGGCLSVMVTGLGTAYEIETTGAVLFIEDVAERPYRIDRMMTHLRQAGKFDDLAGVVFGPMVDCDGGEGSPVLREICLEALDGISCPVLFGLDAGHGSANTVLPFGCDVEVDGDSGKVELLESPFRD